MKKRLAYINFIEDYKQIKIRNKLFLRLIPNYFNWYIKRFNPILVQDKCFLGVEALDIDIPITRKDASKDKDKFNLVINNTLNYLSDHNVCAVIMPDGCVNVPSSKIQFMTGKHIFTFLILKVIKKLFKIVGKDLKNVEILIIDTDELLTDVLIEILYPHLNYLTIVTKNINSYAEMSESIFKDTGLNLNVVTKSKGSFNSADVIINTYSIDESEVKHYKKGAFYISVGNIDDDLTIIIKRRPDMIAIDCCNIWVDNIAYSLKEIEALIYLQCREFQDVFIKGFNNYNTQKIMNYIKDDFKVGDLVQNTNVLKNRHFTKYTSIANIDK